MANTYGTSGAQRLIGLDAGVVTALSSADSVSLSLAAFNVTSTLGLTGAANISGDLAVATDKFTVASASGNTAIAGTLSAGASTLASASVTGNASVGGNLSVSGNLTVSGTTTTVNTTNLNISDPLIQLAAGNAADLLDIGFVGLYNDGAAKYAGFFRDASAGKFRLFSTAEDLSAAQTINVGDASYAAAALAIGALEASNGSFSGTLGVTGAATLSGDASVGGALSVTGNSSMGGTLSVTGNASLASVDIGGGYGSSGVTISAAGVIQADGAITAASFSAAGAASVGSVSASGNISAVSAIFSGSVKMAESADPTSAANNGYVYVKDVAGQSELFWMNDAGDVVQLTAGTGINTGALVETLQDAYAHGASAQIAMTASRDLTFKTFDTLGSYANLKILSAAGASYAQTDAANSKILLGDNTISVKSQGDFAVGSSFAVTAATGAMSAGASTLASASITANASVGGTLGVTGAATLSSTLGVAGDFAVNTNKFTVAAASGNTAVAGTLSVAGDTTLSGALSAGASTLSSASISGTLSVTGASSLSSASISGNATVGGTLGVTGNVTMGGTLAVTSSISGDSISVTGNAAAGGTLSVFGAATLSSTLSAGASTLASAGITGNATVGGTLGVTGAVTLSSTLSAGASTLASAGITGNATVGGTFDVTGDATFKSSALTISTFVDGSPVLKSTANKNLVLQTQTTGSITLSAADYITTIAVVPGENLAAGDLVCFNSSGQAIKADNATAGKKFAVGIASASATSGVGMVSIAALPQVAVVSSDLTGFTVGAACYLGTGGAVVATAPSASGTAIVRLGYVVSAGSGSSAKIFLQPAFIANNP